ncbi:alpha-glucosidase/alpha-galactosidase [Lachnospiraceae bacterium 54-53]
MVKITFVGAGSTIFARNVLGDCMCTESLNDAEISLYDIDPKRLEDSRIILEAINKNTNSSRASISTYLGAGQRKAALKDSDFVVNAIQVGFYDPCTIIDFEIPKKYGLRQTIADTLGIGGIMRGLRTIPVMEEIARDMEEVCPNALFLNYVNPMAIITGYMQRCTSIKTIGLCHSVQKCALKLFEELDMADRLPGHRELIAGINHMAWLLEIYDRNGTDLYPEIRRRALEKNNSGLHNDMVRFEYLRLFGYYCTESSEHNAEYNPLFIKASHPELIEKYNIPLDEYPRRCIRQIAEWEQEREAILNNGKVSHVRSIEYASYIMEAIVTGQPYEIGGNVINNGMIPNLPAQACVEVPCLIDGIGIHPCYVGPLPVPLAAMNMTNVNVQLLTIEAARTRRKEDIYRAALLDPHTAAELSPDQIIAMCDELIEAHGEYMKDYH